MVYKLMRYESKKIVVSMKINMSGLEKLHNGW